jgi:ribulose bisphosphate carboxylase small subunit
MRLTQGTFSYLPDLTDDQIRSQVAYAQAQGWAVNVEYTDDPHPRPVSSRRATKAAARWKVLILRPEKTV